MTDAEKKAYNREYYQKYRKRGLKKGRKSSAKKGKTIGLIGVSSAGLNVDGLVEASVIRDRLKTEMNAKLKGAKTDAEKLAIRKEYANKANVEIAKLKANPKFAKPKATKASKGSSGSKGNKSSKNSTNSAKSAGTSASTKLSPQTRTAIANVNARLAEIKTKIGNLSESEKADLKEQIQGMIARLQKLIASQR